MMLDRVLGVLALAVFGAFLGVIIFSVVQPMLIAVAAIGVLLAAFDFWLQLGPRREERG